MTTLAVQCGTGGNNGGRGLETTAGCESISIPGTLLTDAVSL